MASIAASLDDGERSLDEEGSLEGSLVVGGVSGIVGPV